MKEFCLHIWRDEQGVLTFEWVLLLTLLVIGIIGGLVAVRDAMSVELIDVAGAAAAVNLSYSVPASTKYGLGTTFSYTDPTKSICAARQNGTTAQPATCGQ